MNIMKIGIWTSCFLISAILAVGPQAAAQNSTIEFVAKTTPSSGTDEPVRGLTFYLLRKSFGDIGKEAAETFPLVAMDAFVDKLDVSKELKVWMKKNHWVNLAGEDFIKKLSPDDLMRWGAEWADYSLSELPEALERIVGSGRPPAAKPSPGGARRPKKR